METPGHNRCAEACLFLCWPQRTSLDRALIHKTTAHLLNTVPGTQLAHTEVLKSKTARQRLRVCPGLGPVQAQLHRSPASGKTHEELLSSRNTHPTSPDSLIGKVHSCETKTKTSYSCRGGGKAMKGLHKDSRNCLAKLFGYKPRLFIQHAELRP